MLRKTDKLLSVIVITRNRPEKLLACLMAVYKNSYRKFEIIVIDQSDNGYSPNMKKIKERKNLRYIKDNRIGKTKGLNIALASAKGEILCFIDDDNLVTKNWLYTISNYFKSNSLCKALFGKILPYKPKKHRGKISPACFLQNKHCVIKSINTIFYRSVGFGSNMAIKKSVFSNVGRFKEWLGPGNYGFSGGEDGEFITRLLIRNIPIHYSPNLIVYHDRWLTYQEYILLSIKYAGGEIAYEMYYYLQGYSFFGNLALQTFTNRLSHVTNLKKLFRYVVLCEIRSFMFNLLFSILYSTKLLYYAGKGTIVAVYFLFCERTSKSYRL
jgi:cellulose synthase/poly-beta-1,6-N-acetylglucosamine synthase-like glycosyltransferase